VTPPTTPVEKVVAALTRAGYRTLNKPFSVATVPFEFAAVLVGPERTHDLIVVVDTVEEAEPRIKQKVEALSRALDVARSRRPLTVILAGPQPATATIEALARVSRVLPIGTPLGPTADRALDDWLAVLLPLHLPQTTDTVADAKGELYRRLKADREKTFSDVLLAAASEGADAVESAFRNLLTDSLGARAKEA
jgi:hypothetical protein